ncbi:MAG: ABC transporter substrate-binding protein [Nitrospirota bacterium]|nr:ABC transporter substrate-binding protein [Nitrospirota bacterium]
MKANHDLNHMCFTMFPYTSSPRLFLHGLRILWTIWLPLIGLFSILGCTESLSDHTLRFGLANSPSNLDPRYATDATSARINRLIYSRLVDFNEEAIPIPALASWIEVSPTHYRFDLREPRPIFHNGAQLSAKDIKATYESILNPERASPHRGILQLIARIDTPTESTVDFFLKQPDSLFPGYLVIGILPANLIAGGHPFHDLPIGSGPFRFLERPDETRLVIERRADGQRIEFLRIPDPTVRTLKLLAKEIHLIQNDLPPELVSYLSAHDGITLQQRQGANFAYLGFNQLDPVVGQENVRKAIAHAINREQIIQFALKGRARVAQALFPPEHWAGLSSLTGYNYNPEQAKTLLKEAGFTPDHRPAITYKTSTDPFRLRLATIIQYQLHQVGIDVSIQSHDWGTFYGDIKAGHFQMYSLAWVGVKSPDIFRYAFHSDAIPPAGANRGHYSDAVADHLMTQAEHTSDRPVQQTLYRTLQARLSETLPYVPLWFEDHFALSSASITGYQLGADGNFDGLSQVRWATSPSQQVALLHP